MIQDLVKSDATYYTWRKEYGRLRVDQAKRFKEVVADLWIEYAILKEAARGNF